MNNELHCYFRCVDWKTTDFSMLTRRLNFRLLLAPKSSMQILDVGDQASILIGHVLLLLKTVLKILNRN